MRTIESFIPLDKSWIIRMGILDLFYVRQQILLFLNEQEHLGNDLRCLKDVIINWETDLPIDVGESATLYRFLRVLTWTLGLEKKFVKRGTLLTRPITDDPDIRHWPQEKLLELDGGTSQWASAVALFGDGRRITNPPYKLQVTYDAINHWFGCCTSGKPWEPRVDQTILKQAQAYIRMLNGEPHGFVPEQAEDFCFAYAFGIMTAEEGLARWPSLTGHESNRTEKMPEVMVEAESGSVITSLDHRVIQAVLLRQIVEKKNVRISSGSLLSVKKSWPLFTDFLREYCPPELKYVHDPQSKFGKVPELRFF